MAETDPKTLVRRLWEEVYTRCNLKALEELMAPEYLHHPTAGNDLKGRDAIRRVVVNMHTSFPGARADVGAMVAEGDVVATRVNFHLTHRAEFWGIPASHRTAILKEMMFHRVRDGKIAEGWSIGDNLGFLQQLGAMDDACVPPVLRRKKE